MPFRGGPDPQPGLGDLFVGGVFGQCFPRLFDGGLAGVVVECLEFAPQSAELFAGVWVAAFADEVLQLLLGDLPVHTKQDRALPGPPAWRFAVRARVGVVGHCGARAGGPEVVSAGGHLLG